MEKTQGSIKAARADPRLGLPHRYNEGHELEKLQHAPAAPVAVATMPHGIDKSTRLRLLGLYIYIYIYMDLYIYIYI